MKKNEELLKLIKSKNFDNVWSCINYLLIAGYDETEAFNIGLAEFANTDLMKNVAYIRSELKVNARINSLTGNYEYGKNTLYTIRIGLINDTNKNLIDIYRIYRDHLHNYENFEINVSIEKSCEVLILDSIPSIFIEFIEEKYKKKFGCAFLSKHKITMPWKILANPNIGRMEPIDNIEPYRPIDGHNEETRKFIDLIKAAAATDIKNNDDNERWTNKVI